MSPVHMVKAIARGIVRVTDPTACFDAPRKRASDAAALSEDWKAVGRDIQFAMNTFGAVHVKQSGHAAAARK